VTANAELPKPAVYFFVFSGSPPVTSTASFVPTSSSAAFRYSDMPEAFP